MRGYVLEEWNGLVREGEKLVAQKWLKYWELGDLAIKVSRSRQFGQHARRGATPSTAR